LWTIVETAGGVFSPLAKRTTNFDLARALEPCTWLLVAADALGTLHDVTATLEALRARGRSPDLVVMSASRTPDLSTGTNAGVLAELAIAHPAAVLSRGHSDLKPLARLLLSHAEASPHLR
ncbi:MAG TPA: dethiobiotin synthase, partial [Polyangiaceae bacterium]